MNENVSPVAGSSSEKDDSSHLSPEQTEQIAQFFEENVMFYDLTHHEYKNREKRSAKLKEFSDKIGLDPDRIWNKFVNMRTDFFKLRRRFKGKSGDGQARLTALQTHKLKRYAFLAAHYKGGDEHVSSSCLGSVSVADEDNDELETLSVCSDRSATPVSIGSVRSSSDASMRRGKRKEGKKDISDVLSEFLSESRRELQETQANIREVSARRKPNHERDAWANWLGSLQHDIPENNWRQYQKETFEVAMEYLRHHDTSQPQQDNTHQTHQQNVLPLQSLLQPQGNLPPQASQFPVMFQMTPAQASQPIQSQPFLIPSRMQTAPISTAWDSSLTPGLLGIAMPALNTPVTTLNLGDVGTERPSNICNVDQT